MFSALPLNADIPPSRRHVSEGADHGNDGCVVRIKRKARVDAEHFKFVDASRADVPHGAPATQRNAPNQQLFNRPTLRLAGLVWAEAA